MAKYVYKWEPAEEILPTVKKIIPKVFKNPVLFFPEPLLSNQEIKKIKKLSVSASHLQRQTLVVYCKGKPVAWSIGEQTGKEVLQMRLSAVLPKHRGNGIYTRMLKLVLKKAKADGYQKVRSYHQPSNTPVLVAKLKAGFVITGFELDEIVGSLVVLTYFFNQDRKKVFDFRTGHTTLPKEIRAKYPKGQI